MDNQFRTRFRFYLRRIGYRQKDLVAKLHVDETTISQWVRGRNPWPDDALAITCELLELNESEKQELFNLAKELASQPDISSIDKADRDPLVWSWPLLEEVLRAITDQQTGVMRQGYDLNLYFARDYMQAVFDDFLMSTKTCFVLIGHSGVGKTSFLLSLLDELQEGRPDVCPLVYDGQFLDTAQKFSRIVDKSILDYLELNEKQIKDGEKADFLRQISQIEGIHRRRLLVIIDGVNENPEARQLLRQVDALVRENPFPWLKIVLTSRPEAWRTMSYGLSLAEHKYYRKRDQEKKSTRYPVEQEAQWIEMTPFTHEELSLAYEGYQQHFYLQTKYSDLDSTMQHALRNPLSLRLIADSHRGRAIPNIITVSAIAKVYVDNLIEDGKRLTHENVIFLETELVPLLFRDDRYTNSISYEQLAIYGLLSRIENDDHVINLVDTGILIKVGQGINYNIRFRYERFYDYFAGRYLLKRFEESVDKTHKVALCEKWIGHLDNAPFLWEPLSTLMFRLLEQEEYVLIETLGNTKSLLQAELIASTVKEHYSISRYQTKLKPILLQWLSNEDQHVQGAYIAATVAADCLIETILEHILLHSTEKVQSVVVQDIHKLWQIDTGLTVRLLRTLSRNVSWLRPRKSFAILNTIFRMSFLMVCHDYLGASDKTSKTVDVVRSIWNPIFEKLLLVSSIGFIESGLKRLRRGLVHFVIRHWAMEFIQGFERERHIFDIDDAKQFFPANNRQKQIMERLIAHFDAAVSQAPEPVSSLTAYIAELAHNKDDNIVIILAAYSGLIAHIKANPLETALALEKLFADLDELYPPAQNPTEAKAVVWYPYLTNVFLNLSYEEDYAKMEPALARQILTIFINAVRMREFRYRDYWRFANGQLARIDCMEELLFGYVLDIPEAGRNALREMVHFNIEQQDHDKLRWAAYSIAIGMKRYQLPEAGVDALYDFIQILQETGYLEQLDEGERTQFWEKVADDLIKQVSIYREHLIALLEKFEESSLPHSFIVRIRSTSREDSLKNIIDEAFAWAQSQSFNDENPFLRNFLKWHLCTATQTNTLAQCASEVTIFLIDSIYEGESLFGKKYDPCQQKLQ